MSSQTTLPSGRFTVLYFASAGTFTSKDSETFEAPLPLSQLFKLLEERYAGIYSKVLESSLVTVNLEYVDLPRGDGEPELLIKDDDEVAIIPPVSSG